MWFNGYEANGGNAWVSELEDIGQNEAGIFIRFDPAQVDVGGKCRLIAESLDLSLVGRTITFIPGDGAVASFSSLSAVFERDPFGRASATIDVVALIEGSTGLGYTISGG